MDDLLTTNNIDPGHPEIMPVKAIWRNANTTPMVLLSRPCWEWHMLCATKDDGFEPIPEKTLTELMGAANETFKFDTEHGAPKDDACWDRCMDTHLAMFKIEILRKLVQARRGDLRTRMMKDIAIMKRLYKSGAGLPSGSIAAKLFQAWTQQPTCRFGFPFPKDDRARAELIAKFKPTTQTTPTTPTTPVSQSTAKEAEGQRETQRRSIRLAQLEDRSVCPLIACNRCPVTRCCARLIEELMTPSKVDIAPWMEGWAEEVLRTDQSRPVRDPRRMPHMRALTVARRKRKFHADLQLLPFVFARDSTAA